jgi:hypothetical protein
MLGNKFRLFLLIIGVIALLAVIIFLMNKKSAAESNRDEITVILNNIVANAQTHFKRRGTFEGWTIPSSLKIEEVGTFREKVEAKKVSIFVVGNEAGENGEANVNIQAVITGNNVQITIRN